MIVSDAPNVIDMPLEWMAIKASASVVIPSRGEVIDPVDFCYCSFECEYTELAFADTLGVKESRNDKSSFIEKVELSSDSVVFRVVKDGVTVATIIDSTLGEFVPVGGYPTQPLQTSFIADWHEITKALGFGFYKIEIDITLIGVTSTKKSHKYWVRLYSDELANNTFVIKTFQNGNIENSVIDYTGINFRQSFRIKGKFFDPQYELIIDNYLDETYELQQIQDEIRTAYSLETGLIPANIGNVIIKGNLLANVIFVTDYNIFNYERYQNIKLYVSEVVSSTYHDKTRLATFVFKFTDKDQNNLKRN